MAREIKNKIPRYLLRPNGIFVIENYNFTKPFANFFPGIAGEYGIPLWVFYVNRGQCISSFGIKDKDHALLEFFPANKAWQVTPSFGFRTFVKVKTVKGSFFYEPFHSGYQQENFNTQNAMFISSFDLTLKEKNRLLGLDIEVNYFPLPLDCFAALVRSIKIRNVSSKKMKIQLLDGLPLVVSRGISNRFLKKLGRTAEAWIKTRFVGDSAAFYKIDIDPTDRPEVLYIQEGNFYVSFSRPIVDPESIFGQRLNLDYPYYFLKQNNFRYPKQQADEAKTPSAFGLADFELRVEEEKCFYSVYGSIRSRELLNTCLARIKNEKYLLLKKRQNEEIIKKLQSDITTESSSPEFNFYAQQTYLDNVMRGGYPIIFGRENSKRNVFYIYLRKHGDLERDYNKFRIQPTYFSQGNGNFRDVVQNRRNDIWFNPEIKETNLITFFNLIQTDGFNPLIVKGLRFHLKDKTKFKRFSRKLFKTVDIDNILLFLNKPFTPGSVINFLEENNLSLRVNRGEFLDILMANSIKEEDTQHKQEGDPDTGGFWIDHWTYCLDLLEAYFELFPEKLKDTFFRNKEFKFYDNIYVVKPRKEKYVVYENKIRQLKSLELNITKFNIQRYRQDQTHWVKTAHGKGKVYQTTLITKLICILVNKLASLDPFGCGIEMEANKPNWYDALNGLPALFGSSICETMELKRLILLLKDILAKTDINSVLIFEELYMFFSSLQKLLRNHCDKNKSINKASRNDLIYWDKSYSLKELYRAKTIFGVSGKEKGVSKNTLLEFLDMALLKVDIGIRKSFIPNIGLYTPYFINEISEYRIENGSVIPRKFRQKRLPLFLEAQVHALRICQDSSSADKLYKSIKKSSLYDRKLKMYKVTASLEDMPFEIGRCRAFSRGWLENESIWLHMEYKYLLELLESDLYERFYSELKNILVCFHDPSRYGRNILENCSFLVGSAFQNRSLHGSGFVARLSGSTAEFLHIWRIMNTGKKPFFLNKDLKLNLRFNPILAAWLFKKDNTYSFNFLSSIKVIYHNPHRKHTFGKEAASTKRILIKNKDGGQTAISSDTIPYPYAERIRSRLASQIDIFLE